jgi:hypothetical protein
MGASDGRVLSVQDKILCASLWGTPKRPMVGLLVPPSCIGGSWLGCCDKAVVGEGRLAVYPYHIFEMLPQEDCGGGTR